MRRGEFKILNRYNLIIAIFGLALICTSIFRISGNCPSISQAVDGIDDWNRYAQHGLDIKYNGWLIKSVQNNYGVPGSFLYNYFVAIMFIIFGDSLAPIFFTQALFLVFSVALTFWTFRAFLSKSTQLIFLCGLILFAILDVYVNYTLILLSECLGLFLFSCFTYGFMKYFRSKTPKVLSLTSIFLTLAVMTRPNLIPLVPVYFMTVFLYMHKHGILSWKAAITNCTICAAGLSILPLRNYMITGNPVLLPVEGMEDTDTELAHLTFQVVLQKLAFCFGYLSGLIPAYKIRIHWMIMWAGYFIFLVIQFRRFRSSQVWAVSFITMVLVYLVLTILFAVVHSYGYRYFIPLNFLILSLSIIGFDSLFKTLVKEKSVPN